MSVSRVRENRKHGSKRRREALTRPVGYAVRPGRLPPTLHRGIVRGARDTLSMAMNFLACDREQAFLMPPDPRDWLPEGHLAWFVLASVEEMDLDAFYGSYRQDGRGRAAFEPRVMESLLVYAYALGERSSSGIERKCDEDVPYR